MTSQTSSVITVHMVASLDGFIARKDGRVDWLETSDVFEGGATLDAEFGGGAVSGDCLRLGLADEVRYSIVPVLIGEGIPFFGGLDKDVALHLVEVLQTYAADVVVYGHTHRPIVFRADGRVVVNPGAAGPRRFDVQPSCGRLTIHDGVAEVELIRLVGQSR